MIELYRQMGFEENPFSRFSAEEEIEYLNEIFNPPKYYSTIYTDIKACASRFIFGERGNGKSALIFKLMNDFNNENVFSVLIDQYDDIPIRDNGKELMVLTLQKTTTAFGLFLLKKPKCLRKLNKEEKDKLAFFINIFFETLSKTQFNNLYDKTTHIRSANLFKRIFNTLFLKSINIAISECSEFIGSTINKALGLNTIIDNDIYREYIPALNDTEIMEKADPLNFDYKALKNMLIELGVLIKKCQFDNVVVFYDKIDEYQSLGTSAVQIAGFMKDISLDTSLLLNEHLSFVFAFWTKIKPSLVDLGIRFDKLKPIDITWSRDEMKAIINLRLKHFSNKRIDSIENILSSDYIDKILYLSNASPRHMIMLLSRIYDEQALIDDEQKQFGGKAVNDGLASFVQHFDFLIFYAASSRSTIDRTVNELLRIGRVEFESKDLIGTFKFSSQAANSRIKIMLDLNLIEDITAGTRAKRYKVIEPRICYLIENKLSLKSK